MSEPKGSKEAEGKRLDSWKEIAVYLRKDVRTVQRWEKYEGLPVHRKPHEKLASVYAYVSELQAWWNDGRHPENDSATASNGSLNARPTLIVLPLRNLSEDATQDFFSDGLTEEFIAQLGRIDSERLGVIATTTAMKYKINSKSIAQIGRELGVSYILEGSVRRNDERVRISAALIRASDQTRLWSETYDREIRRILEVQVEVAEAVAREIATKVNVSQARAHRRLVDPAAYSEYLRGRFFWNRRTPEAIARAIGCFEKAIGCDSLYGPAYAGLSDCYAILSSIHVGQTAPNDAMPKAIRAAKKALEIEPGLAEAYATLGHAQLWYEWNWQAAGKSFQRALELNPSYGPARQWYAGYLQTLDRMDECFAELDRLLQLDPFSMVARASLENALYLERNFERVIVESKRTLELDPSFVISYFNLGRAYTQLGMHREAITELRRAHQLSGENPAMTMQLGYALAKAGRKNEAKAMLDALVRLARKRYIPAFYLSAIYTGLLEIDRALAALVKAHDERCDYMVHLPKEAAADPLRGDSRFDRVLPRPPQLKFVE